MKKTSFLLLTALFCVQSISSFAQIDTDNQQNFQKWQSFKKSPDLKAKVLSDTMSRVCALSTDQYQTVYNLNVNFFTQKESLRENMKQNGDKDTFKQQSQALSNNRKQQLGSILSPEQLTTWESWKQSYKEQMQSKKEQFHQNHPNSANKLNKYKNSSSDSELPPVQDTEIFGD